MKHREVCTHGQECHLGGLTSHREQKNNKITNNEFTSAAAEAKAHELLQQTRNKVSRNTAAKNSISVRRAVEAQSGTRGEKLCSQLPSPVHSRKRFDMHKQNSVKKSKHELSKRTGSTKSLGPEKDHKDIHRLGLKTVPSDAR